MIPKSEAGRKLSIFVMIILIIAMTPIMVYFTVQGNPFLSGHEASHNEWVSYTSPDYDPEYGTPLNLEGSGRNVVINPDGYYTGYILAHGLKTPVECNMGIPKAYNYKNGRYVQVTWENWEPEAEWEIGDRGVSVYRMMFAVSVKTFSKNVWEKNPISLTIKGKFDLNTWEAVPDTIVAMSYMEIPTEDEIDEPVVVHANAPDENWSGKIDDVFAIDSDADSTPPNAGQALDMYYVEGGEYGGVSTQSGVISNLPSAVLFDFEILKIKPGVIAKLIGDDIRVDVEIRAKIAVIFFSSRPLYAPTGDAEIDENKGGKITVKESLGDLFDFDIPLWMQIAGIAFAFLVILAVIFVAIAVASIFKGGR